MFLSKKEFENKLRSAEGFQSAVGDLASLTANTGKDMYIARAQVTFFSNNRDRGIANEVVLKINGTIIETSKCSIDGSSNTSNGKGDLSHVYEFKNIGHRVAAGEVIKLEVITLDINIDVEGFIECFEEDTGADPSI